MSISENITLFPVPTPSKLLVAPKTFIKHWNLVLGTVDLTSGSYRITHIAKTIWVHR